MANNPNSIAVVDNEVDVLQNIGRPETSVNTFNGNEFANHTVSPKQAHRWVFKTQSVDLRSIDGSNGVFVASQEVS